MTIILQHKIIMSVVLILFVLATVIQIMVSRYYTLLILETENMSTTKATVLCQCKRKFTNSYRLHNGVLNVSVFVDKYLNRIKIGKFRITTWKHISGQLILLAIFAAGVGACMGIINGSTIGEILPFYIVSMFGLYFYFAVSGAVDIEEKKVFLKTNILDYLENHMGNKLEELEDSIKILEDEREENTELKKEAKAIIDEKRQETAELEELLREFLT